MSDVATSSAPQNFVLPLREQSVDPTNLQAREAVGQVTEASSVGDFLYKAQNAQSGANDELLMALRAVQITAFNQETVNFMPSATNDGGLAQARAAQVQHDNGELFAKQNAALNTYDPGMTAQQSTVFFEEFSKKYHERSPVEVPLQEPELDTKQPQLDAFYALPQQPPGRETRLGTLNADLGATTAMGTVLAAEQSVAAPFATPVAEQTVEQSAAPAPVAAPTVVADQTAAPVTADVSIPQQAAAPVAEQSFAPAAQPFFAPLAMPVAEQRTPALEQSVAPLAMQAFAPERTPVADATFSATPIASLQSEQPNTGGSKFSEKLAEFSNTNQPGTLSFAMNPPLVAPYISAQVKAPGYIETASATPADATSSPAATQAPEMALDSPIMRMMSKTGAKSTAKITPPAAEATRTQDADFMSVVSSTNVEGLKTVDQMLQKKAEPQPVMAAAPVRRPNPAMYGMSLATGSSGR